MSEKTLATLHKRLKPLAVKKMPVTAPPPRDNRFGRPLELAKAHWVRPELVAEITYLNWPDEGLLRIRPEWPAVSDEEFASFDSHHRASDYAETAETWKTMAREAGFSRAEELLIVPNQLARVYRFSH